MPSSALSEPAPPLYHSCTGKVVDEDSPSKNHAQFAASVCSMVLVACVQDTKLGVNSTHKEFTGYAAIRRDRPIGGGGVGLVTLVCHYIPYRVPDGDILPDDDTAEVLPVEVDLAGSKLTFVNV